MWRRASYFQLAANGESVVTDATTAPGYWAAMVSASWQEPS